MLPLLLMNVITGLVADKAQDLAKDHVSKMIDDILPDNAKKALDTLVSADPTQPAKSIAEFIETGVQSAVGAPDPEVNIKVSFDPDTGQFKVETV